MTPERADHIMFLVRQVVAAENRYSKALWQSRLHPKELDEARDMVQQAHRTLAQVLYGMVEYSVPDSFQATIDRGVYDINEQQIENSEETKNA